MSPFFRSDFSVSVGDTGGLMTGDLRLAPPRDGFGATGGGTGFTFSSIE